MEVEKGSHLVALSGSQDSPSTGSRQVASSAPSPSAFRLVALRPRNLLQPPSERLQDPAEPTGRTGHPHRLPGGLHCPAAESPQDPPALPAAPQHPQSNCLEHDGGHLHHGGSTAVGAESVMEKSLWTLLPSTVFAVAAGLRVWRVAVQF